jgi:hypothetical protein
VTDWRDEKNCQIQHSGAYPIHEFRQKPDPSVVDEVTRMKLFIGIQAFFLVISMFTGGFHFALWSMLDTALLIQSIGVTGLVLVLEEIKLRRFAFKTAIILYLLGLLDMGINVLVSGVVGWKT